MAERDGMKNVQRAKVSCYIGFICSSIFFMMIAQCFPIRLRTYAYTVEYTYVLVDVRTSRSRSSMQAMRLHLDVAVPCFMSILWLKAVDHHEVFHEINATGEPPKPHLHTLALGPPLPTCPCMYVTSDMPISNKFSNAHVTGAKSGWFCEASRNFGIM
ncbi:hypothetical protein F4821DRAFT_249569, partial [Hypoxylon rubiginosum]